MEHRLLALLISSLVSQALLLLLLLNPKPFPLSPPNHLPHLLHHFLSSSSATLLSRPNKRKRQEPIFPPQEPVFTSLDHFPSSFNMTSTTFEFLAGLLDPLLDCRDPYHLPLPPPARLALALSRLATGAPYPVLARRFNVPVPAARFLTKHLCRVLCTNFRFWIAFPSLPTPSPLPACRGALATTRFNSLAVQLVADDSSRILNIAAGFRADRTDVAILRSTSLYTDAEAGRLLGPSQYLVGTSAYPLLPWLMVPFAESVRGSCEEDFNAEHRVMCWPARRAVLSLRNWGVLSRLAEEEDAKIAVACIGTCAILHNVLLMREDNSALSDVPMECSASSNVCRRDLGLEEGDLDEKAVTMRSKLAARAREIHDSNRIVSSS